MTVERMDVGENVPVVCEEFDQAVDLEAENVDKAVTLYRQVVAKDDAREELSKIKEDSIYRLATIFARRGSSAELKNLLVEIRPYFETLAKSKTAKIVRKIIEIVGDESDDLDLQTEMCKDAIAWCTKEKRTFLKQRMQTKLCELDLEQQQYKSALKLIKKLVREVKRFDDKLLLVEIQLLESKIHFSLENLAKAKGALTSARSAANAVYCPPLLQAGIDLMAGTLCAEEKDYKTAFSYFYEAFESYSQADMQKEAVTCLKYMLLGKIMLNQPGDVYSIVNGKAGIKYAGPEVEAMKAVADTYKERSIQDFQDVVTKYQKVLTEDSIISKHLKELEANLLEKNLIRIIEPYERVQIAHVARKIQLSVDFVQTKLSEMILDKKLDGILDQGCGDLIVFDQAGEDKTYTLALDTVKELTEVVDRLGKKAQKIA